MLLKRRPFKEGKDIVEGVSRNWGRLSAVVRPAKGRGGILDGPCLLRVRLHSGAGMARLSQPELLNAFVAVRRDLDLLSSAGFLGRLFCASLPELESDPKQFALLFVLLAGLSLSLIHI